MAWAYWSKKVGAALPYTPPLDGQTDIEIAYSIRKTRSAYSGNCMRVSDGTNQWDVGFDSNGYLDTTYLLSLGANLWVVTWYDQSGNGNNATAPQADAPKIVDSSSLYTVNGLAAPLWGANTKYLSFSGTSSKTVLFVSKNNTLSATQLTVAFNSGLNNEGIMTGGTNVNITGLTIFDATVFKVKNTVEDTNQHLHEFFADPTNTVYTDGANSSTWPSAISLLNLNTLGRTVNAGSNANLSIIGHIQEYISFTTDKIADRTTLETTINDYFSIY